MTTHAGQGTVVTVGTYRPDQGHSFGRLTVRSGAVVLEAWPIVRRLAMQTDGPVTFVTARFAPPWWKASLILRGAMGFYGAALSQQQAQVVRDALHSCGFRIDDRRTRIWRFPRTSFRSGAYRHSDR